MNNIIFIYGEDTYRSKQKLDAIKQKYIDASLGDTNLAIIDGEMAKTDEIVRQLFALPFLAKSRLVIVKNLLTSGSTTVQERVLEILEKIPQSTVALFYEQGMPDGKSQIFKRLIKTKSQAFDLLKSNQLADWIKDYVKNEGGSIDQDALRQLVESIGPDLWRMSNELDKLLLYDKKIAASSVNSIVNFEVNTNVFSLLDGIGERNKAKAFGELGNLLKTREGGLRIMAMIQKSVRTIAVTKIEQQPPKSWRIHPFVAAKAQKQARNFSLEDLKGYYQRLASLDYLTKIGTIEPETAIAIFIAEATNH